MLVGIKKIVLGAIVVILLLFCLNGWYIDFDLESISNISSEYTEELKELEPVAYLKGRLFFKNGLKLNVEIESNIQEGVVGSYPVKYKSSFLFFEKEVSDFYHIKDSEYPVINLKGFNNEYVLPNEDIFLFTASDNYDGDLTDKVVVEENIDTVVYKVKDTWGNETRVEKKRITDDTKIIYLTFDDGPSKHTQKLLDILDKYNIKATFFVVGTYYTDVISDIYDRGHAIGAHTYSHEFKNIYKSEENYFNDLNKIQEIIEGETGMRTDLLRFPGGTSNTVSRKYNRGIMSKLSNSVIDKGYQYFDWNVDSDDAGRARDSETVFENVKNGVDGNKISIVLQHDTKEFSIDAVEQIIIWGKENGYVFLPLNKYSFTAQHKALN